MSTALVAVVIPCYNLGRFLQEAVDSVRAQTFRDFDLVIVNDGSTDAPTCRVLADYAAAGMTVVESDRRGLSAARNLGIRSTDTPYVTAVDADDRVAPTFLEKSVRILEENRRIGFVSHWLRAFGDEAWEWTPARCDLSALVDANCVNGAAVMRRACFDAVGGFDEEMRDGCEDWDFWISAVEAGFIGTIIPEVLYEYRRRADSMSRAMMDGDGYARIYARLATKHATSFRRYLPDLLARREREIVSFRTDVHQLEHEHATWLRGEVARWRDDVTSLTRKADRLAAEQELRDAVERSASEAADRLAAAADRIANLDASLAEARETALDLDAARHRAEALLDDVRQSASWRVTAPLRSVYGWIRRRRTGHA